MRVDNERNFPQAKLNSEINVSFLLNELGDLHFLSHDNSVHIILFNLKKIKTFIGQKKYIAERVPKPLLWNANYNGKNNDYTNSLRPRRFKWCEFSTDFMILFHMLDTFYLSTFFSSIALKNHDSSYRKI